MIYKTLKIIIFNQLSQLLVVIPVVPDVLHVVAVLQHVDELVHVLHVALVGERDVILRHHLDVGVNKAVSLLFSTTVKYQSLSHLAHVCRNLHGHIYHNSYHKKVKNFLNLVSIFWAISCDILS